MEPPCLLQRINWTVTKECTVVRYSPPRKNEHCMSRTGPSRWAAEKRPLYDHKGVLHGPVGMHTRLLVPEIPMAEFGSCG